MLSAKKIALISIFTALLIGGQIVLSGISGVEVVTVLLLSFSFYFGIEMGLLVANAFSILRCFVFGFFLNVLILYLVYYNIFVVVFGLLGRRFKRQLGLYHHAILVAVAVLMTAFFTVLDNAIATFYYSFSWEAAKRYYLLSLTAAIPQVICTLITVMLLLPVLVKIYTATNFTEKDKKLISKELEDNELENKDKEE